MLYFSLLTMPWGQRQDDKMIQLLRALAAPAVSLSSASSTHMVMHNHPNSSSRNSNALFWSQRVPGITAVHIHACRQTLIHINLFKNSSHLLGLGLFIWFCLFFHTVPFTEEIFIISFISNVFSLFF